VGLLELRNLYFYVLSVQASFFEAWRWWLGCLDGRQMYSKFASYQSHTAVIHFSCMSISCSSDEVAKNGISIPSTNPDILALPQAALALTGG
jgi:hypothetical protein